MGNRSAIGGSKVSILQAQFWRREQSEWSAAHRSDNAPVADSPATTKVENLCHIESYASDGARDTVLRRVA
jgi:hypothetical protein